MTEEVSGFTRCHSRFREPLLDTAWVQAAWVAIGVFCFLEGLGALL